MKAKERGAVVVEASIGLTAFIFFVYTLLTVIHVCLAQAKIGVAVNTAAKELSQYCYLYSITGVQKLSESAHDKGATFDGSVDDVSNGIEAVFDEIGNVGSGNIDPDSIKNTGKTAYGKFKSAGQTVMDDPKEFILSAIYASGNDLFEWFKNGAGIKLVQVLVQKNLKTSTTGSVEDFLKHCRIVPKDGSYFDGLDFSGTEIFPSGMQGIKRNGVIKIFCEYDVSLVKLLNHDVTFHVSSCGKTIAWSVGEAVFDKKLTASSGEEKKNPDGSGNDDEDQDQNDKDKNPSEEDNTEEETAEEETTQKSLTAKDYAEKATQNPDGEYAVLGYYKYTERQYHRFSEENGYTYFYLEEEDQQSARDDNVETWDVNKEFLQSQINQRKSFILLEDPENPRPNSNYEKEIKYLKDHDYEIVPDGPHWKAVKKGGYH